MRSCNKCDSYRKKAEKYKDKYEIAKSGLTEDERDILIELICNEQLKYCIPQRHHIPSMEREYKRYNMLEELKAKIRVV